MLVGIYKPKSYGGLKLVVKKYADILEYNNIPYVYLDIEDPEFWEIIKKLDLFIYYWGHKDIYKNLAKTILPIIENEYGVKCLPNQRTCWHYDDKIKQYYQLSAHNYPVIPSWIFWDKNAANKWLDKYAGFPLVFKLTSGAGSQNVILVKNKKSAKRVVKKMFGKGIKSGHIPLKDNLKYKNLKYFIKSYGNEYLSKFSKTIPLLNWSKEKNYAYFQEFLPNNEYDLRVTTIGNRAFAFRRFVRNNDFRASGSNNWSLDRKKIDMNAVKIAKTISREMGYQIMAYDFIYNDKKEPRIVEISYTYGDYPEFSTGYIDDNMNWVNGQYWTQYLALIDALELTNLKQPDIKPDGHYANVL